MKLPNARLAVIEQRKVADYLLNAAHPDNGGKAKFFHSLGFSVDDVPSLLTALCRVAEAGEAVGRIESGYGVKFVVDGILKPEAGTRAGRAVRTIWIIEHGETMPRFVTAYPAED